MVPLSSLFCRRDDRLFLGVRDDGSKVTVPVRVVPNKDNLHNCTNVDVDTNKPSQVLLVSLLPVLVEWLINRPIMQLGAG
jgi:hypothetical protein